MKSKNNKKDLQVKDRFFLEEIIFRLKKGDMEYVNTLLKDWMREMVENNPLTEAQRNKMIKSFFGKEAINTSHFPSEAELKNHIGFVEKKKSKTPRRSIRKK